MIMQHQSNEESCNLLIQSLIAKDEKLLQKILEQEDEDTIKDIINRVPVNHVRKLVIELRNILSNELTVNHLKWLQHILALKYSVISSMADGRSILIPLISLLEDRSSPEYCNKMQGLKGKITLLKQLKEARGADIAETVVRVRDDTDLPAQMEVESETDTESEEEEEEDDEAGEGEEINMHEQDESRTLALDDSNADEDDDGDDDEDI